MLLGLFTRPVAFILSGQMAVAYFTAHAPRGTWPILNGGELAVLFCFLWLFFAPPARGRGASTAAEARVDSEPRRHEITKITRRVHASCVFVDFVVFVVVS